MAARLQKDASSSSSEDSQRSRGHIEGRLQTRSLPDEEFGYLKNYLSSELTKVHATTLARSYGFPRAQMDKIENSEEPSVTFIDFMAEKGLISERDPFVTSFLEKLRGNDFGGIADKIKRVIDSWQRPVSEDELIANATRSKIEDATFFNHHSYMASAPEESGSSLVPLNQTPKRKSDSMEQTQQEKKGKQMTTNQTGKSDLQKCFIYIHSINEDYGESCIQDKATLIGVASEIIEHALQIPKKLYMIRREGGMKLKEKCFYSFGNYTPVPNGNYFLIGPHTTPSIVSNVKFRNVELHKYEPMTALLKSSLKSIETIGIPSVEVKHVKYLLPPKQVVLSVKGIIKEVSQRGYGRSNEEHSTPRRVITLIDCNDNDFLSVVLHETKFPISACTFTVNSIVELKYFETARTKGSSSKSNFLTSTRKSIIEGIEDETLNHLIGFQLVRGRGTPIKGIVTQVDEVEKYPACPGDLCYLKEVNVIEGGYFCPKCKITIRFPKNAYYVKLYIDSNDGQEYKGIIFTQKIDELKAQLQFTDSSTEDYLKSLPQELLDWEVDATFACNNSPGLNNIFSTIELVQKHE